MSIPIDRLRIAGYECYVARNENNLLTLHTVDSFPVLKAEYAAHTLMRYLDCRNATLLRLDMIEAPRYNIRITAVPIENLLACLTGGNEE